MASLFQFSIRSLLITVTITAVGIAALLNANGWWEAAAWGAALLALGCAVLLLIYRQKEQRAFWVGFAVFGGMYLALVLYSTSLGDQSESSVPNPLRFDSLGTTKVMALAYTRVIPESRRQTHVSPADRYDELVRVWDLDSGVPAKVNVVGDIASITFSDSGRLVWTTSSALTPNPSYVPPGKFLSIGHTLWLLLIAAAGGKVCQIIYRTRPQAPSP